MMITDAAERLMPARHLSRIRQVRDLLKVIARGGDDLAVAQRMALIAFAIRVVSAAIAFVSQVILARLMGNFDYGIYVFVWVLAVILGNLSCLGFHTAVIRFLPQYRAAGQAEEIRGLTWTARVFSMISASFVGAIGIATVLMLGDQVKDYYVAPLILGAFALPMIALGDVLDGQRHVRRRRIPARSLGEARGHVTADQMDLADVTDVDPHAGNARDLRPARIVLKAKHTGVEVLEVFDVADFLASAHD